MVGIPGIPYNPGLVPIQGHYGDPLDPNLDTSKPWYQYPYARDYGGVEPFSPVGNPSPKADLNFQLPAGYPILNILPGTVTGIDAPDGSMPAWGSVVTIKLDTPLNIVATHEAYLHLYQPAPNLKVGQHLGPGDLVGYNGGSAAAGTQKVPLGFALFNGDYYGYGPSWSQYLGSPQLDPTQLIDQYSSGQKSVPNTTPSMSSASAAGLPNWLAPLQAFLTSGAIRVALFAVGLIFIIIGFLILIHPNPEELVKGAALA